MQLKIKIQILLAAAIIIVCANACSNKSEDVVTPPANNCDTTNVSYANDVLPIISNNCYSCHGNGVVSGGVSLDGYANLKVQADNGNLKGVITHASGYPAMPQGQPKLPDCEINTILAWINDGTPNN